jgi:hypothetical protein
LGSAGFTEEKRHDRTIFRDFAREISDLPELPQHRSRPVSRLEREGYRTAGVPRLRHSPGASPVSAKLLLECEKLVREVTTRSMMLRRDVSEELAIEFTRMIMEREEQSREVLACLKLLVSRLEDGTLVRNLEDDGGSDWAIKMIPFVQELNRVTIAIHRSEEPKPCGS